MLIPLRDSVIKIILVNLPQNNNRRYPSYVVYDTDTGTDDSDDTDDYSNDVNSHYVVIVRLTTTTTTNNNNNNNNNDNNNELQQQQQQQNNLSDESKVLELFKGCRGLLLEQ